MRNLETIKKNINKFIADGGNIYLDRRQLPYYSALNKCKREMELRDGKEYTMVEIYKMCGIDYDKEYYLFTQFASKLGNYADNEGYVDSFRKDKNVDGSAYKYVRYLARVNGVSLHDYIVFMTDYRLKEAIIDADYIAYVQRELISIYPDRDITGIKRDHPALYENIRHIRKYLDVPLSMAETITYLGFYSDQSKYNTRKQIDEKLVLKELHEKCLNKNACQILSKHPALYRKIVLCAIQQDKSVKDWLTGYGFEYLSGDNTARLSQIKVNEDERYRMLMEKKRQYEKDNPLRYMTPKDKYHYNVDMLKRIVNDLEYEIYESNSDNQTLDNEV